MNRFTEEALERYGDDDLRALSCTIELILEGRRKRVGALDDTIHENKRARNSEAIDSANKALEQLDSAAAGEFILTFGKHKGSQLKDVELSYLAWAIGYKRSGMKFAPNPDYCVSDNHPLAYEKIRTYMAWRCWACRSPSVRFRNAKLCTSCWLCSKDS